MKLMIESMFFILFGITFLFILLLIYHFKNKITVLEKNVDTMFEILNNVVGDLTKMKQITTFEQQGGVGNLQYCVNNQEEEEEQVSDIDEQEQPQVQFLESEEDSEEEDSDEEEEDSEEEDSEEEDSEEVQENTVKTISVDLDNGIDGADLEDEEMSETQQDDVGEITGETIPILEEVQEINIAKVDIETANLMDSYKKMHVQNLKKLVMSKGLVEDASKMKKVELLGLLENE